MKIAIVGPSHPYKGGIAQQTTQLAHELTIEGNNVDLISWKHQFPFFYPGKQFVEQDEPEIPIYKRTKRILSWRNPFGWWKVGRGLNRYDHVILVWWVPTIQGPVYTTILKAISNQETKITVICHNVLPHESRFGDKTLTKKVLNKAHKVIVHTQAQSEIAKTVTFSDIQVVDLPLAVPPAPESTNEEHSVHNKLLFFGFVRPYKGLNVLIEALSKTDNIQLEIAGEFWQGTEQTENQISKLSLGDRVTVIDRYLSSKELAEAITNADAVVLPYISGTASQHVALANFYGKPVIATTAGSFSSQVTPEINGLLCEPNNVTALASAINQFYEPGVRKSLERNIEKTKINTGWSNYVSKILDK